jgi:hypothetical protein
LSADLRFIQENAALGTNGCNDWPHRSIKAMLERQVWAGPVAASAKGIASLQRAEFGTLGGKPADALNLNGEYTLIQSLPKII